MAGKGAKYRGNVPRAFLQQFSASSLLVSLIVPPLQKKAVRLLCALLREQRRGAHITERLPQCGARYCARAPETPDFWLQNPSHSAIPAELLFCGFHAHMSQLRLPS